MSERTTLREVIETRGIHGQVIVSAELGLNHDGDPAKALRMIEAAAECGVQAVKVQNYRTGDVVQSRRETITVDGRDWNAWDLFGRCELDRETLRALKDHAEQCGLIFHSTPTNEQGIRDLEELGVRLVKIASDVAQNWDMVCFAFMSEMNVVLSMGCLTRADLRHSETVPLAYAKPNRYVLLHCVREYPTPRERVNLPRIAGLRRVHPLVGYSDHTEGIACAVAAVRDHAACWIEKHFTLDKQAAGPDHRWSADPKEMRSLVRCLTA